MSALGQKRTCAVQKVMSALHPIATAKADIPWWGSARPACRANCRPTAPTSGDYLLSSRGPIAVQQCRDRVRALLSCWLHLSRGIDFSFLGDRLSICLICAAVLPRMPYPRRSSSAIASRLSSSTVFLRGAMMADRIGKPEPPSLCQPSQNIHFLLATREIHRQDY
jgi:hypothetical protein